MLRRPCLTALPAAARRRSACRAVLYAQLESGERGILPIDSSGTLEITGIHVDVGGKDAQSARYAGWRVAQREGFRALWAKTHKPPGQRSAEPAAIRRSTGWSARSSSSASRSAPTATSPTSASCSTAPAPAQLLGVGGEVRRSAPMLLIPITVTGGTATSVELRNAWQRAWAQFRTSQSPIDYVRVSGLGVDPLLVNAAQTQRPGPRLVAQHRRPLRRRRHPGRRSPAPAPLSRRAGAARASSAATAPTTRSSAASR